MKTRAYWTIFAACSIAWLSLTLWLAPSMNGTDVFIFRDAGWNLASSGRFESAALPYMRDLTPRLFAHYTPMMPLLFAGFLKLFGQNAYAGSVFNLLLGAFLGAVTLYFVLLQPVSKLRNFVALLIAICPVIFVVHDRPEALGVALFGITLLVAHRRKLGALCVGFFLALTFLTEPLMGIFAAVWSATAFYLASRSQITHLRPFAFYIARIASVAGMIVGSVAVTFYVLDASSLQRFLIHALGFRSGLGVVAHKTNYLEYLHGEAFGHGLPFAAFYFLVLFLNLLLCLWLIKHRKDAGFEERLPLFTTLLLTAATVILFPAQGRYITALGFLMPVALLAVQSKSQRLNRLALVLLCVVATAHLPEVALTILQRAEQQSGFHAAQSQPEMLLDHLATHDSIVAVEGGSYDLYKPYFHRLIELDRTEDVTDFSQLAGLANCYGGFNGESEAIRPLPARLNPSEYELIQRAPSHLWVTAFGHRLMSRQWGYGCDLYIRAHP